VSTPERPQGVRIHHADGGVTPVELAYVGTDEDGLHVWECITPVRHGERVTAQTLPARSSIVLPWHLTNTDE
jgi:hypothetical protein